MIWISILSEFKCNKGSGAQDEGTDCVHLRCRKWLMPFSLNTNMDSVGSVSVIAMGIIRKSLCVDCQNEMRARLKMRSDRWKDESQRKDSKEIESRGKASFIEILELDFKLNSNFALFLVHTEYVE